MLISYLARRGMNSDLLHREELLKKEREANSTRKKPLDDLEYISVDLDRLPFGSKNDNEIIASCQKAIANLKDRKIVNLTGITNTDLKLRYGAANLPLLTEYDQNYTNLCRNLYDWGKELNSIGDVDDAVTVLEYGIDLKTDIKAHYLLLADIYVSRSEFDKVDRLAVSAENIHSLLRNSLIDELKTRQLFRGE